MVLRGTGSIASDAEDPNYVPGNWYQMLEGQVIAGGVITTGFMRLLPFRLRQAVNIAQLGARITTLAGGGLLQLAVYAANRDTLLPTGQPLIRSPNLATDAAGLVAGQCINVNGVSGNVQLPRGVYWQATAVDATAGGTVICAAINQAQTSFANLVGAAAQLSISPAAAQALFFRTATAAFGVWPDLTAANATAESNGATYAAGQFQVAP